MSEPATGQRLWVEAFRVERAGIDPLAGLAGAVATGGPLALGVAVGEPAIGVIGCFGGLNAALAVPRGPLRERLGWGIGAALLCTLAVALSTFVQPSAVATVVAAFLLVALATALRCFGPDGGLTGFVIGAIFTITAGIPAEGLDVGERTLWFAAGSAIGVVLMVLAYARDHPLDAAHSVTSRAGAEAALPLRAVLADGARQLRETLAHDALLRAHALRLATVVALTTALYRAFELEHGYWIPLTVLAVLQPDEHASRVRALQRGLGTLIGTVVIALLIILTGQQWAMVAAQTLCAFGLFALFARGYFWLVVLLTPTALLTISAVDYEGAGIALQRAGWSAVGIVTGLAIGELVWRLAPHLPSVRRPVR
ncbi:FUSC family protein [Conexibacter stalactiti]|uniref:FUSC family protein n=1 Tax=Conexibacter stalactiti TaxID=1940611 RepID=A0ABU4HKC0_9ACTN|nr:FUSC family protein [Conexibacter stalactiti]MDW5593747.1 FUSC family protein [Conexibacter stalactiti]MEC5034389.1 FUSC family protein [Conexibacter stalactiti]